MLLLASTSDLLRVVTTQAVAVDVHASWADMAGTGPSAVVTPGRTNTAITSATTTTVVGSPGASTYRTVKTLAIRNKHASAAQEVTVVHTDGTTAVELIRCALAAGWCLHYHEAAGFFLTDTNGRAQVANFTNVGTPSGSSDSIVMLGEDVINNNAVANTIADVTGLSFPVLQNKLYWFEFNIIYTAAATTTGSRWTINGPATPTYLDYQSEYSLTTTTSTRNAMLQAYDSPASSNATSAATGNNWALINGVIQPSADGTVIARFASEIANSAITAKIGSFVRYRQISP